MPPREDWTCDRFNGLFDFRFIQVFIPNLTQCRIVPFISCFASCLGRVLGLNVRQDEIPLPGGEVPQGILRLGYFGDNINLGRVWHALKRT